MPRRNLANRAVGLLNADITNVATSLTLQSGQGARFSSPTGGARAPILLVSALALSDPDTATYEIVWCTARSTDTLTVTRAQEGTSGVAWTAAAPTYIFELPTKELMDAIPQRDATESITGRWTWSDVLEMVAVSATPTAPSAGNVGLYARKYVSALSVPLLGYDDGLGSTSRDPFRGLGADGWYTRYLHLAAMNDASGANVAIGAAGVLGSSALTTVGTNAGISATTGSVRSECGRTRWTQVAGANANAGWYIAGSSGARFVTRGSAAGRGGFFFAMRFGLETVTSNLRLVAGLYGASVLPSSGDPSTIASDMVLIGCDQADANLSVLTKDNTTANKAALSGGAYSKASATGKLYDLVIACLPNDPSGIFVYLASLDGAAYGAPTVLQSGYVNTNLPRNTVWLAPALVAGSGSNATDQQVISFSKAVLYWQSE